MTDRPVIAILGGGNGGFCAAADLSLRGFEVRMWESPTFAQTIEPVIQEGGIFLRGVVGEGFAKLAMVTTDIQSALEGADLIMVIVQAAGHKPIARTCAPYLKAGQAVVLAPGCCGGVLEFRQELLSHGCLQDVTLAETTSLMYAVKKEGSNRVWARGIKNYLPLAAFPSERTPDVLNMIHDAYPQFEAAANVLDTSFHNLNHIVHPPGMLMNLGFIESERIEKWFFYQDGYTPGTGRLGEQMDTERLEITSAYHLPGVSVKETLCRYYAHQGLNGANLFELFNKSPVHNVAPGPKTTHNRMLAEDVPYGLVPLASFGKLTGVPTPAIDSVITIASVINQTDYRRIGRTVEKLGLGGMSAEEVVDFVNYGSARTATVLKKDSL